MAKSLERSLDEAGFETDVEIGVRLQTREAERRKLDALIQALRSDLSVARTRVTERLSDSAHQLASEVQAVRDTIAQVESIIEHHRHHRNELLSLSTNFPRVTAARTVLNGCGVSNGTRSARSRRLSGR